MGNDFYISLALLVFTSVAATFLTTRARRSLVSIAAVLYWVSAILILLYIMEKGDVVLFRISTLLIFGGTAAGLAESIWKIIDDLRITQSEVDD